MTDKKVNISDVNEEGYPNREVTNQTVDHSCRSDARKLHCSLARAGMAARDSKLESGRLNP